MLRANREHMWIVVKVESGIPATIEAHEDRQSAAQREESIREHMHPENDETGIFEIVV